MVGLCTGHCRLNLHLFQIGITSNKQCILCNGDVLNIFWVNLADYKVRILQAIHENSSAFLKKSSIVVPWILRFRISLIESEFLLFVTFFDKIPKIGLFVGWKTIKNWLKSHISISETILRIINIINHCSIYYWPFVNNIYLYVVRLSLKQYSNLHHWDLNDHI